MMRGVTLLLILAVLLISGFYVSYLIGYQVAPKLYKLGYEPEGLQHHEISKTNIRSFKPDFYPSRISL